MSTLTAFDYIGERSEATPGLWNRIFSTLSDNIRTASEATDFLSSATTFSFTTGVSAVGGHFQHLSVGSTPPSTVTTAAITVVVNSSHSDYLYLVDSSAQRASYVIGSRAGATGDGLNIWDASNATMLATFSDDSIRFWQPVVGNSFDQGGAVFNFLAYGGISDDSTDNSPSLRTLLNVLPPSGGDILFNGQFAFASTITVQQTVRFIGTGVGSKWRRGVNSDITGSGSQLRYTGTGGDFLVFQSSAGTPQLHPKIESLTVVGNRRIAGSTRGVAIHFLAPGTLLAVNPTLTAVHVQESSGDGIAFDGNVFEGGMFDCVVSQCSESGVSAQANAGGLPGELAFYRNTLSLNSIGMALSGGGDFSYHQLTSTSNTHNAVQFVGVKVRGSDLHMESNGSVYARFHSLQHCVFHGISINYAGGSLSTVTGVLLDGNCVNNAIMGYNSNSTDAQTDIVLNTGCQATYIFAYHGGAFTQRINDQGFLTQIQYGSQYSRPVLTFDGSSLTAAHGFQSERSLGWYRSGASAIGLTYGQLALPAGTATAPSMAFSSESSLGWYRSAASVMALSYGTLQLPSNMSFLAATGIFAPTNSFIRRGTSGGNFFADVGSLNIRDGDGGNAVSGRLIVNNGSNTVPTIVFASDTPTGFYRSGASTVAMSNGTFNLATNGVRLSMRTQSSLDSTSLAVNEVAFSIAGASGATLAIRSGGTIWYFDSSASTKG